MSSGMNEKKTVLCRIVDYAKNKPVVVLKAVGD